MPDQEKFDYRVEDIWDNGEFLTGAKCLLFESGQHIHTENFFGTSEFDGGADAKEMAISYGVAYVESQMFTLEERLGPYGIEWQREQDERRGLA